LSISLFTELLSQEKLKSKLSLSSQTRGKILFDFPIFFSFQEKARSEIIGHPG